MARLGLRTIKKPNLIGSFGDNHKPLDKFEADMPQSTLSSDTKSMIDKETHEEQLETRNYAVTSNGSVTGNHKVTSNRIASAKSSLVTSNAKVTSNYNSNQKLSSNEVDGNSSIYTSNQISNPVTSNDQITSNYSGNQKLVTGELRDKASNYTSNLPVIENTFQSHFLTLSGLQRKIVTILFNLVKNKPDLVSDSISIEHLADLLGREKNRNDIEVLKKTIIKLQHKGFISKKSFKVGRGGYTSYALNAAVFYQCSQTFGIETSNQLVTQPVTKQVTSASSKLVSDLSNNLLTSEPTSSSWILELSGVEKFGITQKHIQDLRNQKLVIPDFEMQEFLERFEVYASDAQNIRSVKSLPALFISMAQRLARGENPLDGVETSAERALSQLLAKRKDALKRKQETEDQLLNFEFDSWLEVLPAEERSRLVPETAVVRAGTHPHMVLLKEYFRENIWPQAKQQLIDDLAKL